MMKLCGANEAQRSLCQNERLVLPLLVRYRPKLIDSSVFCR